jgi:hypothetical protein
MAAMASQGGTQARQMTRDEEKGKQKQSRACCFSVLLHGALTPCTHLQNILLRS